MGRYKTLAVLNVSTVNQLLAVAARTSLIGPAAARFHQRACMNALGTAASWAHSYMRGPGDLRASWGGVPNALSLASRHNLLHKALIEIRTGTRGFETMGDRIRMPYLGDLSVDALDLALAVEQIEEDVSSLVLDDLRPSQNVMEWQQRWGPVTPWSEVPGVIKDSRRANAATELEPDLVYFPAEERVAGVQVRDLNRYWCELRAWGDHMSQAATTVRGHLHTIAPLLPRERFIEVLASGAGISEEVTDRITAVLTLDLEACPDPALTPLVALDGMILPMSALIATNSPQRNFVVALNLRQHKEKHRKKDATKRYKTGDINNLVGTAGNQQAADVLRERLRQGACIAKELKVIRTDGKREGDIDVAVCDHAAGLLVLLEVKWDLGADDTREVYRAISATDEKRDKQVKRVRGQIIRGEATVRWPPTWPDVSEYEKSWFVLTNNVIPSGPTVGEIPIRSVELIRRRLKPGASVRQLVDLLNEPPPPPDEQLSTTWKTISYLDLLVELEDFGYDYTVQ